MPVFSQNDVCRDSGVRVLRKPVLRKPELETHLESPPSTSSFVDKEIGQRESGRWAVRVTGSHENRPFPRSGAHRVLLSKVAVEKKWHVVVDCEHTYVVPA